jgi:hypothetical protein
VLGERWRLNPRVTVPRGFFHVVRAWYRCRGGMGGYAVLPEAGGLNAQPAWLLEAFAYLAGVDSEIDAAAQTDAEEPAT